MSGFSRRRFLEGAALGGALLSLGFNVGCSGPAAAMLKKADESGDFSPNVWITVLADGKVAVAVDKAEMGQGVATAYATLVAEELEVAVADVTCHFPDSAPEYGGPGGLRITGGSNSTASAFLPIRRAAAAAREMLAAAAAATWSVPVSDVTADGGKILHPGSGRSLGYGDLTRAAARQPVPKEPKLKPRDKFKQIGKHAARVDLRTKVTGKAQFGLDVNLPGMLHAVALHGPVYGAPPVAVRDAEARKMPGIVDIFALPWGVAVVAKKHWQALAASKKVEVDWGRGSAAGLDSAKLRDAMRKHDRPGAVSREDGDVDGILSKSKVKVEAIYDAPYVAHATMEPQNCTVQVKDGSAEVWAPTQAPTIVQEFVGAALGLSRSDVLVHTTLLGGGFGRRAVADWAAQAAQVAKRFKEPVQLVWTRESDMRGAYYRPLVAVQLRGAVGDDGRASALHAHVVSQSVAETFMEMLPAALPGAQGFRRALAQSARGLLTTGTIPDFAGVEGVKNSVYEVPNFKVEYTYVQTGLPIATWRSVGHSVNGFAMEGFVDELAHAAKQDPLEFRRRQVPAGSRAARVLDALAKLSKWGEPLPKGVGRGVARHESFETEVAEVAEVEIVDGRIKVRRVYCVVDCGLAVNPDIVKAQMEGGIIFGLSAALDQEITLVDGVVQQKNFDTFAPLRMFETPEIVVQVLENEAEPTGVGEPGLPPIAPAVANAIFALTGKRLRRLPLQRAWNEEAGS